MLSLDLQWKPRKCEDKAAFAVDGDIGIAKCLGFDVGTGHINDEVVEKPPQARERKACSPQYVKPPIMLS